MEALSEQEALVGVAMCAAFADGAIGSDEDDRLSDHLAHCRALAGLDEDRLREAMMRTNRIAAKEGDAALLARAAAALRPELRETAFFLAADLVLADGGIALEERAVVERMRKALGLDPLLAERIVEVVLIRHRA